MSDAALILTALLLGLVIYIAIPPLVAFTRQHPERRLIYKLSPLCLLSLILWLVLVAWAFTGQRNDAIISRYVSKLRGDNRLPLAITLLVLLGLAGSLLPLMR
ncbi:hypothetical protein ASE85_20365 [Sphingobium sp. Leaf26]|uniref:hypothetical protein n=1 Tax=Sphingobium sp. Leaf26 TaxID=1735693 RepID=UPI0006F6451A|nr:hypothetical protein [Sphingobium sp. Leaf26]KQN05262.1 hypothetical protein ASE85_20365 [Sphingobium sp. Leaf26]